MDWVSVFPSLDEGGLSVVVLGTARSLRTPLGREDFCEPTGAAVLGLSRSVRLGPDLVLLGGRTGRPTHWASSSLLVESVR